jgi:excinuclease ABC subunit C
VNNQLTQKLENVPSQPGVYIYRDVNGAVLYVGKAKRLKNRVRSYFQDSRNHDGRIRIMISKINDIEIIVTDSESEALILENTLIKEYAPRYNVMYRDDKSYPYICMTAGERPRIFPTRSVIRDGSRYWGPYDNVAAMKAMLETIRKTFGLCTCACTSRSIDKTRGVPKWNSCFEDYFDDCSVQLSVDIYSDIIAKVTRLLNGRTSELVRDLRDEMQLAAEAMAFEDAAKLRDGIAGLERFSQKMKVVSGDPINRDVFALHIDNEDNTACGVLFRIREGKLIGSLSRIIRNIEGILEPEIMQGFVEDYYTSDLSGELPDEVYLSVELDDDGPIFDYLRTQRGRKVPMTVPQIGEKAQLVRMAEQNARIQLKEHQLVRLKLEEARIPHSVQTLKADLFLPIMPRRIECFDNSNLQGTDPVASMVSFVDGQPRKSEYKRYTIKTVVGPDDFASMREIIMRRYGKYDPLKDTLPDLVVVDGGKGQLSSAVEALHAIGMYGKFPIIGLAKRLEEVFFPGETESIIIPKTSSSLKLLQRVRDEAHRFAITFHRDKRSKRTIASELDDIPGVGPRTREKLIKHFGSVKKVREAFVEDLNDVVGKVAARRIRDHYDRAPQDPA